MLYIYNALQHPGLQATLQQLLSNMESGQIPSRYGWYPGQFSSSRCLGNSVISMAAATGAPQISEIDELHRLPPEIRNMLYDRVFDGARIEISVTTRRNNPFDWKLLYDVRYRHGPETSLFSTCR